MMHAIVCGRISRRLSSGVRTLLLATLATPASPESPFPDRLTGDWNGLRTRLADRGIRVDIDSTHYYQGLLSGSGGNEFDYGGRIDVLLDFDAGKLGLWEGGVLRTHTEYRYGDLSANLGGVLVATNTGRLLPTGEDDEWVVTSIHLAQRIGERASLLIGKINALDLLAGDPFFGGGGGQTWFLNMAFAAPPSGVTPASIIGAVLSIRGSPFNWTFMVFDPEDRTDDYWPDALLDSGINVSVSANFTGLLAGRTSSVTVTGTYTTKDGADLGELLLPPELQTGDRDDSWFLGVQFAHFLRQNSQRPGDGWGLFVKLGGSDGNPNPFQSSLMGGIGGRGLFASRPNDSFGIGYFYVNFSDDLQSSLDPFLSFEDEQGVEAFYTYLVKDWLPITADLQYVNPGLGDTGDAFVAGLRVRVRF